MGDLPASAPIVFKKRSRANVRQRNVENDGADDEVVEDVAKKAKTGARGNNALQFSSKAIAADAALEKFAYAGTGEIQEQGDQGATRMLETETAYDQDARARREAVLNQGEGAQDDGQYRGMNAYKDWKAGFRRENTVASEKSSGAHGPMRGTQYMRSSIRMDYQPDICKDYKETGFCSYGDTCKFLHDRSDYKSGWELEREWAATEKAKQDKKVERLLAGKAADDETSEEEEDDDDLPFACYMCRRPWEELKDAVATRCKHYFCEECALKHSAKSKKCFVCGKETSGIFNVADEIHKRFKVGSSLEAAAGAAGSSAAHKQADAAGDDDGGGWSSVA